MPGKKSWLLNLDDAAASNPALAGTKAATLAGLKARGLPVPPGFVVTTAACQRILSAAGDTATSLMETGIPADVWAEILLGLRELGDIPLAVRSSGVAEDLAGASFAGQYESVLGVRGPVAVAKAIGRCLASASSARVRAYAGASAGSDPMAVLIQRLVPADAAGVAFTANPVTGDREVLVSAVRGLGDRLVSGEATPDEWVVKGDTPTCLRAEERALVADQVRAVAALATRVEELAGAPQDLEWAIAGGELFLLQARPITALPIPPQIEPPAEGFWRKDTAHYPMPLTPFGASVYLPALAGVVPALAPEVGLLVEASDQRSLGGEVYVRMIPLGGKERRPPPSWAIWIASRLVPAFRRRARAAEKAIATGLGDQFLERWHTEWRGAFQRDAEELRRVALGPLSDDALLAHLDRLKDFLDRGELLHFRLHLPYALTLYELSSTCEELLGWDNLAVLTLLTGSSQASSEPGRELEVLALRFASDPAALRALEGAGDDVITRLQEASPEAASAFAEYLDRYGHRTVGYDPGEPTLFECPALFAGLLRDCVHGGRDISAGSQAQSDALERARATLAARSEEDRNRFERAVTDAQHAYGQREDNIFWLDSQPCALIRYAALEIGRRLTDRGCLGRAGEAVYLEEHELRHALGGEGGEDLRPLIARRKAERAWVVAHPGPASYGRDPGPPPDLSPLPPALRLVNAAVFHFLRLTSVDEAPGATQAQLRGVPGSPGRYSGPARVIRDETEFSRLRPGDVLVCPITSPVWSVLFIQAGAVVTDGGGVLAHTAVIAREYGIPAVLATGEATRRLRDGDIVTVDGTSGTVSLGTS